ncbi:HipA domain-containing protein [Schaalia sp. ZJ1691]|uniref:HipA domain-containing protein n=1 Tax=Schaalia sp. ZJ1691 TaxID=2709404 RepID=UPI0013EAC4E9|nr:HipA domain-containing protein [Schaalia sp. ZJ1691]
MPGGAVFAREDEIDNLLERPGRLIPASEADIAQRLRRIRRDGAAWQEESDAEHWSLAGAQSKFALARTAHGWAFAQGSQPSTHIVKPGIDTIRSQALIEHVSMRALDIVGLPVAHSEYQIFEDQPAIVIRRFDRGVTTSGATIRIHQEDLVQSFATDPRKKYESDGGPGVQRISTLLRMTAGEDSVERFARAVIANYIIGAPDAHAKNYGVLLVGPRVSLTPLYDVATGLVPDANGRLRYPRAAMSIGGERRFGDVERKNWEHFARLIQLPPDQVIHWVNELATSIPGAFEQAAIDTQAPDAPFLAGVVAKNIAAVAQQTRRGLSTSRRVGGRIVRPFIDDMMTN